MRNIEDDFPESAWQYAVGSAGTFKAIEKNNDCPGAHPRRHHATRFKGIKTSNIDL